VSTLCSAITAAQRRTWSSLSLLREPIGWRRAGAPRGNSPSGADPGEGTGEQSGAEPLAVILNICNVAAGS
jgi:hypothetical protein